jgi:dihydrolipoamide dehydrogenase
MKQIVVIGGGPGGYPAALKAAALGAKVTLVEKKHLGGVCLNCGCIPSKSFLHSAHEYQIVCSHGVTTAPDFEKIKHTQQAATQKLVQGISFLLKKAGVEVLTGEGKLLDTRHVQVTLSSGEVKKLEADGIILATGSEAFFPSPFDTLKGKIYDNSNFFTLPTLPKTLAIVGGGVIGCEMADCMNALGVNVHLIEMQSHILPQEDANAAHALTQTFTKRNIVLHIGVSVSKVAEENGSFVLTLSDGNTIVAEQVLAAIGRTVNTAGLGLENIGITPTRKGVEVDPQTLQLKDTVYAVGDLNGLCLLAHAATRQGEVAASNLCGVAAEYHNERVPRAIYNTPEIASAGATRAQLQAAQIPFKSHKSFLLANGRAVAQGQTTGFFEIFSHAETGKVLGGVLVGAQATELVHVLSMALTVPLTIAQLKEVIFAHPTLAESIGEAVSR